MTEDEAKGKMCCGPPLLAAATLAVHPDATVDPRTAGKCIGSVCMAWRERRERCETAAQNPPPASEGWIKDGTESGVGGGVTNRQRWTRTAGFCGLAGAPQ